MALLDEKKMTLSMLAFEFLRRIVNELDGRRFSEIAANQSRPHEIVVAQAPQHDVLKVLPEMTREFAQKIKPEFTNCHTLAAPPAPIHIHCMVRDPMSGVSIRCFRHFDVMEGEFRYRFDAAFS